MLRTLLAVLILTGQFLAPAKFLPLVETATPGMLVLLASQIVICHADDGQDDTTPSRSPLGYKHDCSLCVLGSQTVAMGLVPEAAVPVATPRVAMAETPAPVPPSTGPPREIRHTARQRAPPFLFL